MDSLPPNVAARIDRALPLRLKPFNGQEKRAAIVREIAGAINFDGVVETGTYRGATTASLAATFGQPVATVEASPRYHQFAQRRLAAACNVRLALGDARDFLRDLSGSPFDTSSTLFFYLDAHWEHDLPLAEELRIIADRWPLAVVMIDDFRVPDDPGYGFDDYGSVGRLTADYVPDELREWTLLYPAAPSSEETGARRGCCVLASPALPGIVERLSLLRVAQ